MVLGYIWADLEKESKSQNCLHHVINPFHSFPIVTCWILLDEYVHKFISMRFKHYKGCACIIQGTVSGHMCNWSPKMVMVQRRRGESYLDKLVIWVSSNTCKGTSEKIRQINRRSVSQEEEAKKRLGNFWLNCSGPLQFISIHFPCFGYSTFTRNSRFGGAMVFYMYTIDVYRPLIWISKSPATLLTFRIFSISPCTRFHCRLLPVTYDMLLKCLDGGRCEFAIA